MDVSKVEQQVEIVKSKFKYLPFLTPSIITFVIVMYFKLRFFSNLNGFPLNSGAVATYVGLLLVLSSFALLLRKFRFVYLFILNLFVSILLFANTLYLNYYGSPITIYTLLQVNNLNGLGDSIFSTSKVQHYLFFLDLVLFLFVYKLPFFKVERSRRVKSLFFGYLVLGVVLVSLMPMKVYISSGDPFREFTGTDNISRYSLLGHHVLDVYSYFNSKQTLDDDEIQMVNNWFRMKHAQSSLVAPNSQKQSVQAFGKDKNLILIQVESLQNFVINKEVNGQEITPNLNRMLNNSLYFPSFYPQTIEGNSSDAEFLTQTSLYPISKGAVFFRYPNNQYFSLGKMLKEKGYSTLAMHGDEATFWNRDQIYPNLGFDDFKSIKDFQLDEEIGMGLSDVSLFHQSVEMLKKEKQPFYSFMITLTSHFPFDLPQEYRSLNLSSDFNESLLGGYIQSIHYTDKAIGLFINELQKANLLENSIIVIYGDHNGIFEKDKNLVEKFLEKGTISNERWIHDYVPVPLIVYNPKVEGQTNHVVGGQIDVFPTVATIMGGTSQDTYYTMGSNLLSQQGGAVIIPKGDYSTHPSYYITKDKINSGLGAEQKKAIDVSNLIIRGNYFKEVTLDKKK